MSFGFLYMFLFYLRRGVDFVHLKCFRYFEGSRIRFFGDCEQFEESSPCLPGLQQTLAYAFSLLCNFVTLTTFQLCTGHDFSAQDFFFGRVGRFQIIQVSFKIRMDIFGLTQYVLSRRQTSSEPFNFFFKTLTEVKISINATILQTKFSSCYLLPVTALSIQVCFIQLVILRILLSIGS